MYIFLITLFGFLLRLININKPEGLWNDEYVSWAVSSLPFKEGFWTEIFRQCHMPLYYLYLKPFAGYSDLILRFTSVIPSVAAIPVMYLAGREFSKKTGYFAAVITAGLPFLIYYAQEVRFYSLLFFFTSISLLFTIRLIKNPDRINIAGWAISAVLILLTHVLGGIYLFFNLAYIIYKKKILSLKLLACIIPALLIICFFGSNIIKMLPSSQWWGRFSYTNILFLFSDFLSPILSNNINAPPVFFYEKNLLHCILISIPALIGFTGIVLSLKKAKGLLCIVLGTVFVMSLLAITGKIVFITKYSTEVLPAVILLVSLGFSTGRGGNILFIIFMLFNLGAVFTLYYPPKLFRSEGNKLAADLINQAAADVVITTYYAPDRFSRYLASAPERKYLSVSKLNRFNYVDNPAEILKTVEPGRTVSVLFLNSVSFIPENIIEEAQLRNIPEMFITFSKIKYGLVKEIFKNYRELKIQNSGSWTLISAKKYK